MTDLVGCFDGEIRPLTPEEVTEHEALQALMQVPVVPASVSMRQARLALLATPSPTQDAPARTLLDVVTAYMATASKADQIEWDYATDIWRHRDLVVSIGAALGLTSGQIDALFIAAAAVP